MRRTAARLLLPVLSACLAACLAACLVVTGLRLLQPNLAATPLLAGFAPLLVPVYVVGLLLMLLPWPTRSRRVRGAVGAVAVGALALHLAWVLPTYAPQDEALANSRSGVADAESSDPDDLRVMTVNVLLGRADPEDVRDLVARVRPDVLVLAEVGGGFAAALEAGQVTDLPVVAGDRDDSTRILSRLEPAGAARQLPVRLGWQVTLRAPLTGGDSQVTVFGVHPIAPHVSTDGWWAGHRALARSVMAQEGPVVIAGDLNATLDHGPVIELQQAGFVDAARAAGLGWAPTWPTDDRRSPVPLLALDHVMARGAGGLVDVGRSDVTGSDHQAVWATWRLTGR